MLRKRIVFGRRSIIVSLLVLLTLISCRQKSFHASLKNVETQYLNVEEEFIYDIYDNFAPESVLYLGDDWIVLSSSKGDYNIQFLNISTKESFFAIPRGRGPGEMIYAENAHFHDGKVVCYDYNNAVCVGIDAEKSIENHNAVIDTIAVFRGINISPSRVYTCRNGFIAGNVSDSGIWYSLYDSSGKVLSSISAFENDDFLDGNTSLKTSAMISSRYCSCPDGSKVCVSNTPYPALSFSLIENGSLVEYRRYCFGKPGNANGSSVGVNFLSSDCDESYVYLLYSGSIMSRESIPGILSSLQCGQIIVYDWEGNPISRILLEQKVVSISIRDGILLGLSTYPEYKILKFSPARLFQAGNFLPDPEGLHTGFCLRCRICRLCSMSCTRSADCRSNQRKQCS